MGILKYEESFVRVDSSVTVVYWTGKCLTVALGVVRCMGDLMIPYSLTMILALTSLRRPNDFNVLDKFLDAENIPYQDTTT